MDTEQHILHETSTVKGDSNICADIARKLYARLLIGKVIVVASDPETMLKLVQKHWLRIIRQHQRERADVYDPILLRDLTNTITSMQSLRFTLLAPFDAPGDDVFVMTPDGIQDILPQSATVFVATTVTDDELSQLHSCMPHLGLVVNYTS